MKEKTDRGLRKGLVGYSAKHVKRVLDEQDTLIRQTQGRADAAQHAYSQVQARLADLERQLAERDQQVQSLQSRLDEVTAEVGHSKEIAEAYRQHADRYRQQAERLTAEMEEERADLDAARAELDRAREEQEAAHEAATQGMADLVNGEVTRIIAAAQESAERIVETARQTGRHHTVDAERMWQEVQDELARFVSWWEQLQPMLASMHSQMEAARGKLGELGDRVREALSPILQAMIDVDGHIARASDRARPPDLKAPQGVEPREEPDTDLQEETHRAAGGNGHTTSNDEAAGDAFGVIRLG